MKEILISFLLVLGFALQGQDKKDEAEMKAYLGVYTEEVGAALSSHLKLKDQGLVIKKVVDGSPAEEAGLKKFDVLLKVGDKDIKAGEPLADIIHQHKPGEKIDLKFIREGVESFMTVELGENFPQLSMKEMKDRIQVFPRDLQGGNLGDIRIEILNNMDDLKKIRKRMMDLHNLNGGIDKELQKMLERIAKQPRGPQNFQFNGSVSSVMSTTDGEHNITVKTQDGDRTAKITDLDGKLIFEGPINTEKEIEAVPEEVREKIKNMGNFKIKKEFH